MEVTAASCTNAHGLPDSGKYPAEGSVRLDCGGVLPTTCLPAKAGPEQMPPIAPLPTAHKKAPVTN